MRDSVQILPRGRHGLAREEVLASQRARMLDALIEAVAEHGYAAATVSHVVKGARVSRETFYEHFSGKAECYLAAHAHVIGELLANTGAALRGPGTPLERLDRALAVYLESLSLRPAVARAFVLERHGAGKPAHEFAAAANADFADELTALFGTDDRFACDAFLAMLNNLVQVRVAADEAESLPALREPLMRVVRRYVGGE